MNRREWFQTAASAALGGVAAAAGGAVAITPTGTHVRLADNRLCVFDSDLVRVEDTWVVTEDGCERAAVMTWSEPLI